MEGIVLSYCDSITLLLIYLMKPHTSFISYSDYEYNYSYYGGYDTGMDQESTILEEPDLGDVGYVTAA